MFFWLRKENGEDEEDKDKEKGKEKRKAEEEEGGGGGGGDSNGALSEAKDLQGPPVAIASPQAPSTVVIFKLWIFDFGTFSASALFSSKCSECNDACVCVRVCACVRTTFVLAWKERLRAHRWLV